MILVREVFQVQFGRAREAVALAQEGMRLEEEHGGGVRGSRLLTDLTGDYYQLVLEQEFDDLAGFERSLQGSMAAPEFREWYPRFAALMAGGRREIFRVVPTAAPPRPPEAAIAVDRVVSG